MMYCRKKIIGLIEEICWKQEELNDLAEENSELKERLTSPSAVIEATLDRGIDWYDYDGLDKGQKISYYRKIQSILINDAFENEVKHFLGDLIQEIAMSDVDKNKDKILRYSVNGVKTLLERLESLEDPTEHEPTKDNIHDVI